MDAGCSSGRLLWTMAALCPLGTIFHGFDLDERVEPGVTTPVGIPSTWEASVVSAIGEANGNVHVHIGVATGQEKIKFGARRVENIEGVTHLMAVWEAWTPDDKRHMWDIFCTTNSARVMCMVQKAAIRGNYFNPVEAVEKWKDFTITGPFPAAMESKQTMLHAWIVRKKEGWLCQDAGAAKGESVVMWEPYQVSSGRAPRERKAPNWLTL
jgi:hypothetical protein